MSASEVAEIDFRRGKVRRAIYLRLAALGKKLPCPLPQPSADAVIELGKIGSNLNQIARKLNSTNEPSAELVEKAVKESKLLRLHLSNISGSTSK